MQRPSWQLHINSLESCAQKNGILQSVHPAVKTFFALWFSICVSSCHDYHLTIFIPYFALLVGVFVPSHIPVRLYLSRLVIALPFSLLAGIWGCFYDHTPVVLFSDIVVSGGFVMLLSIICRTLLSVGMILILVGTTTIRSISEGLRYFHIPWELTLIFELIMRYISVLFDEVIRMKTAWTLRGGSENRISLHYFGSLAGNLFLRSFDRASRIYQAMQCRGYPPSAPPASAKPGFKAGMMCFILCIVCLGIRILF